VKRLSIGETLKVLNAIINSFLVNLMYLVLLYPEFVSLLINLSNFPII